MYSCLTICFSRDVYKAERNHDFSNTPAGVVIAGMLLRISCILYEILASYVYSKLWSVYYTNEQAKRAGRPCSDWTATDWLRVLLLLSYTIFVIGVVGVGFAESEYLWSALT